MKKIFVTGGAGFIGSTFVRQVLGETSDINIINFDALTYAGNLENLHDLDAARHQFVKGDICDKTAVLEALPDDADAIFNFAAESHVDRSIASASEFVTTSISSSLDIWKRIDMPCGLAPLAPPTERGLPPADRAMSAEVRVAPDGMEHSACQTQRR